VRLTPPHEENRRRLPGEPPGTRGGPRRWSTTALTAPPGVVAGPALPRPARPGPRARHLTRENVC